MGLFCVGYSGVAAAGAVLQRFAQVLALDARRTI